MVKRKYIDKYFTIGIEIEIGLMHTDIPRDLMSKGWERVSDPSIRCKKGRAVELRSPVYSNLWDMRKDLYAIKKGMGFIDTDKSMGIHIHLKPKSISHHSLLFSRKFCDYFASEYMTEYGHLKKCRERLRNEWCRTEYPTGYFRTHRTDTRYLFVNIGNAYNKHGTIEFRGFPTTKSIYQIFNFLNFTVQTAVKFIKDHEKKPIKRTVRLEDNTEEKTFNEDLKKIEIMEVI